MTEGLRREATRDPLEGVSADGTIVTGARRANFSAAFVPVLERAVALLAAIEGNHSLHVYGSVATGTARPGRSDVDLVTIGLETATARGVGDALSSEFASLCRSVELGPARRSDYEGTRDEAYGNRVFLRHYCVHLAGPDIAQGLPDFRADAAAARGFNGDIGLCADRWRTELAHAGASAALARRIARKTLLTVAGLVSMYDATWTTDRLGAAARWACIRPSLASQLDTVIAWSDDASTNASASASDIGRILEGLVAEVVEEFRSRIGLWRGD